MKVICPNFNNKEVKQQFDELVANVGENAAYVIWSENNGNSIDKAPNGAESNLFSDLLSYYNGDRNAAIKAKAKMFAKSFKIGNTDINGEPVINDLVKAYRKADTTLSVTDALNSHLFPAFRNLTDSSDVIQKLLEEGLVPTELVTLAKSLQKHSVAVTFTETQDLNNRKLANYSQDTGITIYPRAFDSNLASTILHEVIHHYTIGIINNPQTKVEQQFRDDMVAAWEMYKQVGDTRLYGFQDPYEFISEVQSNLAFRSHLQTLQPSLWARILNAFKSLLNGFKTPSTSVQSINNAITRIIEYSNENGIRYDNDAYSYAKQLDQTLTEVEQLHADIIKGLKQRLNAIQRYAIDRKRVQNEYNMQKLIDQLSKDDSKVAVVEFIQHINDTIADAVTFLNADMSKINSRQLVQLRRDYLNYYGPMIRNVSSLVENTDLLSDMPNYDLFVANVNDLVSKFNKVQVKFDRILKSKTREFLADYANQSGSPFTDEMLNWIDNPNNDISWVAQYVGMASNTDNEVVRIMENMIRNVKNKVDRNTRSVGQSLLPLLDAAKKKHGNDVMELLQERDSDGKRTGYFVRDRNYGQFYRDRKNFYDKQAEKYKLEKDDEGRYIPPADDAVRAKYESELNDWLNDNTERLFTKDYYDLRNSLKQITRDALGDISQRMMLIRKKYTIDKVFYNHRMTLQDQEQMKTLARQKTALANLYDLNGKDKTGDALLIAQDLIRFNAAIGDGIKYNKQSKKFTEAMTKMYKLLPLDEYAKWYAFNTHSEYSDEFWKLLDSLDKVEQSDDYKELKSRQKAILAMYRKDNSMEYDTDMIDMATVRAIKALDEDIAAHRSQTKSESEGLKFKDVARIALSDEYTKQYKLAQEAGQMRFDEWYERNHYEDAKGVSKPISIWTYLEPIDPKHIVTHVPNMMFSEIEAGSKFVNNKYDQHGEYVQPKLEKYDNKKAYNKVTGSNELNALYESLLETMVNSTKQIGFLQNADPYKLPQMTARVFQMVARDSSVLKGLKYAMSDAVGIKDDDKDYVDEFQLAPDGTPIKNIPTRYLNLLDDPNMITADVVGSVIEFFSMANNFQEMSAVQDDLEMILGRLSQLEVTGKKGKTPGELNVFKKAQQLVDMNLYGQKKQRLNIKIGSKEVEVGKGLSTLYQYVTKVNLAYNMWAIGANYVTGQGYTDMESILSRYYSTDDVAFAKAELLKNMPQNTANIGNVNVENKLLSLMQLNQVTRSNQETYDRLDNSVAIRAINQHFWFNGYTAGDFAVKSQVLAAVYHSYRYYKGEFLNKNEFIDKYYAGARKDGAVAFSKLKDTLYDAYDKKGNVLDKYADSVTVKLQNRITNKINTLSQKIDGNLSDTDKSAIHANMFAHFLVMHRNFMIVGIQDRFKGKQFNYNTGETEVGTYRSVGKLISQQFSSGKFLALRQLTENYNNLEDYEKYNVKKVLLEIANILVLSLAVSTLLIPLADSGDGEDDWAMQAITYLAMRSAFEFRTMYNPFELTSLLNSPSAAMSSIDNIASMLKLLWIPNWLEGGVFKAASSGPYKGMPKILKNFIKFTPAKNIIEASDPKPKRNYLQNQLMM